MSQFHASANATSSAHTNTSPQLLVTASASATATSNASQNDAQTTATQEAQQVADSTAQNNANIISQTINSITAQIKGAFGYLSILYGVPTEIGATTFTGLVFLNNVDSLSNSLVLNYEKPLYYINSLTQTNYPTQIIPGATLKGFYSLTYVNNVDGTCTLTGQRTTYKYIPYLNSYIYNVTVGVNVVLTSRIQITKNTTLAEINGNITKVQIVNKMAQGISTYTPGGNFDKFGGVQLEETYTSNGQWNYIFTNFNNAYIIGSSNNIYPYIVQ